MSKQVFPTKGNLMAAKKSLALANLGYQLLDQKRNVLIKEMMSLIDDVKEIRDEISSAYEAAYDALKWANISTGEIAHQILSLSIDDGVHIKYRSVMGVELPKIDYTPPQIGYNFEHSSSRADEAYTRFVYVKELTVKLVEIENAVYRLANAIRQTQKRANALKNVSIPELEATIKMISDALEEKEREEFSRQKVIKTNKDRNMQRL